MALDLKAIKDLAEARLQEADGIMQPIGGGNPYLACRFCGVTNVQLATEDGRYCHAQWCEATALKQEAENMVALVAELEQLRAKQLEDGQVQLVALALAKLYLQRPGFDYAMGEVAAKLGARELYQRFKDLDADKIAARKL